MTGLATLILIACLAGQPCDPADRANDVRLKDVPAAECASNVPMVAREVSDWLDAHPKFEVHGWRCETGERGRDS